MLTLKENRQSCATISDILHFAVCIENAHYNAVKLVAKISLLSLTILQLHLYVDSPVLSTTQCNSVHAVAFLSFWHSPTSGVFAYCFSDWTASRMPGMWTESSYECHPHVAACLSSLWTPSHSIHIQILFQNAGSRDCFCSSKMQIFAHNNGTEIGLNCASCVLAWKTEQWSHGIILILKCTMNTYNRIQSLIL